MTLTLRRLKSKETWAADDIAVRPAAILKYESLSFQLIIAIQKWIRLKECRYPDFQEVIIVLMISRKAANLFRSNSCISWDISKSQCKYLCLQIPVWKSCVLSEKKQEYTHLVDVNFVYLLWLKAIIPKQTLTTVITHHFIALQIRVGGRYADSINWRHFIESVNGIKIVDLLISLSLILV